MIRIIAVKVIFVIVISSCSHHWTDIRMARIDGGVPLDISMAWQDKKQWQRPQEAKDTQAQVQDV